MTAEDVHIVLLRLAPTAPDSGAALCGLARPLRLTVSPKRATCTECLSRWRQQLPSPPWTDGDLVA